MGVGSFLQILTFSAFSPFASSISVLNVKSHLVLKLIYLLLHQQCPDLYMFFFSLFLLCVNIGGPKAACAGCAGFAAFSVLIEKFLDRHN